MTNKNIKKAVKHRSMWQEAMDRLVRNKLAMVGFIILVAIIVLCCLANVICPEGQNAQDPTNTFVSPSLSCIFGTDNLGRSMLARVLYGGRVSLLIGFVATGISAVIGIILGTIAAYYGGVVDDVIMRILDVFSAIPNLVLAMVWL